MMANNKSCIVTTMKCSFGQAIAFVNYHLNLGIDEMVIFFDDPEDSAYNVLNAYKHVHCVICDREYWSDYDDFEGFSHVDRQLINVNRGLSIAKDLGCEWIIHIDADELIYTAGSFADALSAYGGDELCFTVNEAVPNKVYYDNIFSPTLFKVPVGRIPKFIAKLLCRSAFFEGQYFRAHQISKTATRITAKVSRMGIHSAELIGENISSMKTNEILLLHFDCIGLDDWVNKWHGKAQVSSPEKLKRLRKDRMAQLNIYLKAAELGRTNLEKAYVRLHVIPRYETFILRLLGMLREINIDINQFRVPDRRI